MKKILILLMLIASFGNASTILCTASTDALIAHIAAVQSAATRNDTVGFRAWMKSSSRVANDILTFCNKDIELQGEVIKSANDFLEFAKRVEKDGGL